MNIISAILDPITNGKDQILSEHTIIKIMKRGIIPSHDLDKLYLADTLLLSEMKGTTKFPAILLFQKKKIYVKGYFVTRNIPMWKGIAISESEIIFKKDNDLQLTNVQLEKIFTYMDTSQYWLDTITI